MTALLLEDGRCEYQPRFDHETPTAWPSLGAWAAAWIAEWRTSRYDAASSFLHEVTREPTPWVLDALVALADAAGDDEEVLSWIGAGPLEDLVAHHGHGELVEERLLRVLATHGGLQEAARSLWPTDEVPPRTRARLKELGSK